MTPRARVTSIAATVTISALLFVVHTLIPYLGTWSIDHRAIALAVTALSSAGFYKVLYDSVEWIVLRFTFLKRHFFGACFFQGTWVGFYEEKDHFCYVVELFEQDLEGITVRGFSFDNNGNPVAQWMSSSVDFDPRLGKLQYSYVSDPLRKGTVEQGLALFAVVRDRETEPPNRLYGYSTDAPDGERSPSWEKKAADVVQPVELALPRAMEYKTEHDRTRNFLKERGGSGSISGAA